VFDLGANVNSRSKKRGRTPLHYIAYYSLLSLEKYTKVVALLKENGAEMNAVDSKSQTALQVASSFRSKFSCVSVMIKNGVNLNITDYKGNTALHLAESPKIAIELIRGGADVRIRNNHGETALHLAVLYGKVNMVKILLEHGAGTDISTKDNSKQTPEDMLKYYSFTITTSDFFIPSFARDRNKITDAKIRSMLEQEKLKQKQLLQQQKEQDEK